MTYTQINTNVRTHAQTQRPGLIDDDHYVDQITAGTGPVAYPVSSTTRDH